MGKGKGVGKRKREKGREEKGREKKRIETDRGCLKEKGRKEVRREWAELVS